jgi:phosphomannomutase
MQSQGEPMKSAVMTDSQIRFGTDGWRAIIAEEFTFAAVERLARAYSQHLLGQGPDEQPRVVIGYDNRFLSEAFALRTAQTMRACGIQVQLFTEPVPTPLVSFAVTHQKLHGGVVITASHNPPQYNGFKIKDSWGGSAFESTTQAVEALITSERPVLPEKQEAIPEAPHTVRTAYLEQLRALIDIERVRSAKLKVVIDSMHGTGGRILESLLANGQTEAITIRADRDVLFGGIAPEPIDKNLLALKEGVKQMSAIVGIATDGDADRLGAVNENGKTMTMHEVAPILLMHLVKHKQMSGAVVSTVTQSVVMKRMAAAYGLPFVETPVGFKYVASEMLENDVLIGAEESGGIGIKGHIPERDGIFNGLLLLEALAVSGLHPAKLMSQIQKEFGVFSYDRVDLHVPIEQGKRFIEQLIKSPPATILGAKVTDVGTADGVKLTLADDSWLMFRRSGTEPLLRVYSEATSSEKVQQLLAEAQAMLQRTE